jgi:peptide deformylase
VATHTIRLFGDPVLKRPTSEVTDMNGGLAKLVDAMYETMHEANGVGLAAPQVGVLRRVFVYRAGADDPVRVLINPQLGEKSDETEVDTEGCLSLLGGEVTVPVERHVRVVAQGLDESGTPVEVEAEGLEARVIQHELDHLDGVLIIDRAPKEDRRAALRELRLKA